MTEDNLEGLGQVTVLKEIAERFEAYDQMNDHQLARFQKMTSERQAKSNFDNLPTTKEPK